MLIVSLALIIAGCTTFYESPRSAFRTGWFKHFNKKWCTSNNLEAKNDGGAGIAVKDSKQCNNEQYYY